MHERQERAWRAKLSGEATAGVRVEPGLQVDGVRPIGQTMERLGTRPRRAAFSDWLGGRACVPSGRTIAVFALRTARFLTQTALLALIY